MRKIYLLLLAGLFAAVSCSVKLEQDVPDCAANEEEWPEFITVTLSSDTRTSYEWDGSKLKTSWAVGDTLSVAPYGQSGAAGYYVAVESGSTVTFQRVKTPGNYGSSAPHYWFYPGNKMANLVRYQLWSYENQVQSKSDPMGHLPKYHTMMVSNGAREVINFSTANQSSCMRFSLSGMIFHSPRKVSFKVLRDSAPVSILYKTNYFEGSYYPDSYDSATFNNDTEDISLSVNLDGYGDEEQLTAYMMMSNKDVALEAGDVVRTTVECSDGSYYSDIVLSSALTLTGGRCHTIRRSSGWQKVQDVNYEHDKEVVVLQPGIDAPGMDIVLLGDGFIPEDIEDGTYDRIMRKAYDALFDIQPYRYFKNQFRVSYVKAASPQRIEAVNYDNGAQNIGNTTCFSTQFTPNSTLTTGDTFTANEYAKLALGSDAATRIQNTVVLVVANQDCHAGTCHHQYSATSGTDNGYSSSVVFMGMGRDDDIFSQLVHHEVCGHGFGKLADEYYHSYYTSPSASMWNYLWDDLDSEHSRGFSRNVDKYVSSSIKSDYFATDASRPLTTSDNVYWHDMFGTANNYESTELLGVFEGAKTIIYGYCRPTSNGASSIMNANSGIFNCISRRQIYYRINRLCGTASGNWGSAAELNAFLQWDADVFLPTQTTNTADDNTGSATPCSVVVDDRCMSTPPVFIYGHWNNGVFIKD